MTSDFTGQTFGSYKLNALIGRGGMAAVYRGYQESIDRTVAVKVLPTEFLHDANFAARFQTEAQLLAKLTHPSILPLYDFGTANSVPYIVMPFMANGSLADRLSAQGRLSSDEVIRILTPIAAALDYAHQQGILHRDVKPSNILFDQNDMPFLGDFGIAKIMEKPSGLTGPGYVGTPVYMSPEQARGEQVDSRADIYSLGVVVYRALSGRHVFDENESAVSLMLKHAVEPPASLREALPDLPKSVDDVVQKALAKYPADRYQTATEFAQALARAANITADAPTLQELTPLNKAPAPTNVPVTPPPMTPPPWTPPPTTPPMTVSPPTASPSWTPPPPTAAPPTSIPPTQTENKGGTSRWLIGGSIGVIAGIGIVVLGLCAAISFYAAYVATRPTPTPPSARTPIPTATKEASASQYLFEDDFSDPGSGWEISTDPAVNLGYAEDEYSFNVLETGWFTWSNPKKATYSNIHLEAQAKDAARTSDILFGVICNFQDNQHFYYLGIDTNGNYAIGKNDGENDSYLTGDGKLAISDKLARGSGWYRIEADCTGDGALTLYVDGILIDSVNDASYADGNIGMFVDVFTPSGGDVHQPKSFEVRFDGVRVSALP